MWNRHTAPKSQRVSQLGLFSNWKCQDGQHSRHGARMVGAVVGWTSTHVSANTSSSPPQCPVFQPRQEHFGAELAAVLTSSHHRKARTLKWSSQIQFSLANWASVCTRLRGGERPARCPFVLLALCHRLIMMVLCVAQALGARTELGLLGERFMANRSHSACPTGSSALCRASSAATERCQPPHLQNAASRVPSKSAENAPW